MYLFLWFSIRYLEIVRVCSTISGLFQADLASVIDDLCDADLVSSLVLTRLNGRAPLICNRVPCLKSTTGNEYPPVFATSAPASFCASSRLGHNFVVAFEFP